ncbi:MFS transporter [Dokdonella sp.]|uniref:MFS transporter n=1 Tax=Dokdonella sp. TaxID=2291710 RepID=UPI002F3FA9FB
MSTSVSPAASTAARTRAPSLVLACLATTMLLPSLGTSVANVALPTFVDAFHTSFRAVQWVVLAYLLAVTTLVVSVGRLGDLVGRRRLLLVGVTVFAVASLACGASSALWMLVLGRAGQGLGAAVMMALSLALVGDAVPQERAGRAMGFLGTMSAVGTALGPSLGGLLLAGLGWRSIFFLQVPLGLLALALAAASLPPDAPRARQASFDVVGSALLAITLAAYALSMTLGHGALDPLALALFGVAVAGAALFVRVQAHRAAPLVRLALFRDRAVGAGFAMSALVTTVAMTTLVVGPFHLARALGLSPASVGLVMTAGPLVAAIAGVPAGRAVDRFGARGVTLAGLAAMTLGCVALALLPAVSGVAGYAMPLVAITAGYATFQAANNTAVVAAVDAAQRGVVSGLLNLSRNLGLVTGASAMGAVFAIGTGAAEVGAASASAVAAGTQVAFGVAAMLVLGALGLALRMAARAPRVARVAGGSA